MTGLLSSLPLFRTTSVLVAFSQEVLLLAAHRRIYLVHQKKITEFTMVTMGGDLQPGSLADRLLTGLGQPQINP
jgi:hypothetical protein